MDRFVEESEMARQLSVRPGTYPSLADAVGMDSAQIVVRGDPARVAVAVSKILGLSLAGIVSILSVLMFLMWTYGGPSDTSLRSPRAVLEAPPGRPARVDRSGCGGAFNTAT